MKIGILGVGKLGLCFGLNLERAGYSVIGVDIDEQYVRQIHERTYFSHEPQVNELLGMSKNFHISTSILDAFHETDILFLMVATPSLPDGGYDHSQIERVVEQILTHGKRNERIDLVIGCTVMPGYCDHLQKRLIAFNYYVSYNPEFIAQGSVIRDQVYPDQVLIGEADEIIGNQLESIFRKMCKSSFSVSRMDRLSAEIAKLATNCFLTTKISFANSIGDLATTVGADADKILRAVGSDSRIGDKYLNYGFGFGGPCFPRDNRALNLFARNSGLNLLLSEATDNVNRQHTQFLFEEYIRRYKESETIFFDEVVYKKGTTILEESQQLELARQLAQAGRKVCIIEKNPVIDELRNKFGTLFSYQLKEK